MSTRMPADRQTAALAQRPHPTAAGIRRDSLASLQRAAEAGPAARRLQTLQAAANSPSNLSVAGRLHAVSPDGAVLQRAEVDVSGGKFVADDSDYYAISETKGKFPKRGARMILKFFPDATLDAEEVSLVQTTNSTIANQTNPNVPDQTESLLDERRTKGGTAIDQQIFLPEERNLFGRVVKPEHTNLDPRYHEERMSVEEPLANPRGRPSGGQAAVKSEGAWTRHAMVKDEPGHTTKPGDVLTGAESFEVAAMADGSDFVGSVRWGWRMTGDNKAELAPAAIEQVSYGSASEEFIEAAEAWNSMPVFDPKTGQIHSTIQLPTAKFRVAARMQTWLRAMFNTYPNLQQHHLDTITDTDIGEFILTGGIPRWETDLKPKGPKFNQPILQLTLRDMLKVYPQGEQYLPDLTDAEIGEFVGTGQIGKWEAMV